MTIKVKFVLRDHRGDWMDETTCRIEFIPRVGESIRIMDRLATVADIHYDFTKFSGHNVFDEVTVNLDVKD